MFLKEYKTFYDRLLAQSERYVRAHSALKGDFNKLIAKEVDVNFLDDYRNFAFAKSTKTLRSIISLLEMGNYEDALILSRSVMECYLSQRYLAENFNYSTLANMIQYPVGTNVGALFYHNGVLKRKKDGVVFQYNIVDPDKLSIGKDKGYFYDLYNFLCEMSHCNISQIPGYCDKEPKLRLDSEFNVRTANLIPLFLYCKLFENVVLAHSTRFDTAEEEQDAVSLLVELTEFVFAQLHDIYDSLDKDSIITNHALRDIARNTMLSFKEQTGRVDKSFVLELEKRYKETPFEAVAKKVLLTSSRPSEFFYGMLKMNNFDKKYPELHALVGLEQNPAYHPEGDVWTHTMQVLDRAVQYRDKVSDPYAFMLLALTHDFGKTVTTRRDGHGVIHAIGHETAGVPVAEKFLKRVTNNSNAIRYVLEMIPQHMKPLRYAADNSRKKATDQMFAAVTHPVDLIYFAKADKEFPAEWEAFLWERYDAFSKSEECPKR